MRAFKKRDFPVSQIRRLLEPGPIVLVSSAFKGKTNVMTMAWHTMMEFSPALVGCVISDASHTFELVRRSRECVISVPTLDLARTAVGIGNCSGRDVDKFEKFALTALPATKVQAPLIAECYANLECRLHDARLVKDYNFFVWEVVKAHVATAPKRPRTMHYRGNGEFMVAGETISLRRLFRPEYL